MPTVAYVCDGDDYGLLEVDRVQIVFRDCDRRTDVFAREGFRVMVGELERVHPDGPVDEVVIPGRCHLGGRSIEETADWITAEAGYSVELTVLQDDWSM